MKTAFFCGAFRRAYLCCAILTLVLPIATTLAQQAHPVIRSIMPKGGQVIVTVNVPGGIERVTLESRAKFGSGTWVPVAVSRVASGTTTLVFTLPASQRLELLRVRADYSEPLPRSFYSGTNVFWGSSTNNAGMPLEWFGALNDTTGAKSGGTTREVTESDIWKFDGDTLYFFNQYRGLQVIDISKPDTASIRGTLSLPAAGEQMYLLGSGYVVLLAREWCSSSSDQSEIVVVSAASSPPQVVTRLPVPGYIQESRMVGTALYVVSQAYRELSGTSGATWEWGSQVSSFDLADPTKPAARDQLWYSGYGNVIAATDTYLFVVTQAPNDWWRSTVNIIDITAPDGTMVKFGSVNPVGRVPDKFKVDYSGTVLTLISQDSRTRPTITKLETFSLPDPRSASPLGIVKLGEVGLGLGERVYATRFQGERVYIVTFFTIDPLWVLDLSDPTKPHIAGMLEIPGFSTFLQPLGDRLVAVGVETNRVAVSLFDVADVSKPSLLSRVVLGGNYSWSEANYDEKAFAVLEDAKLILVPYNGDTTNGWVNRVQLIDLGDSMLTLRGVIEHAFQPRRATYTHERILSLSGMELLSVDAADRDKPSVRGTLALAYPVDRLFLHGDYLLEIASSGGWSGYENTAMLRVAAAAEPNQVLAAIPLGSLPVAGASVRGNTLHVAQVQPGGIPLDSGGDAKATNFLHTVIDLSNLPSLAISSQVGANITNIGWSSSWQPVWPKDDVVVWTGGESRYYWGMPLFADTVRGGLIRWPGPLSGGGHFIAVDLSKPGAPAFASDLDLTTTDRWDFSQTYAAGTALYCTYAVSAANPVDPKGSWVQRYYLQVTDYADPYSPTLRKPTSVPGTLQGLSYNGEMLYTTGYRSSSTGTSTQWLDASAYDVEAHLIASLQLPDSWPRPLLVNEGTVFLGRAVYPQTATDPAAHELQSWKVDESTGKFVMQTSLGLKNPASAMLLRGGMLALQDSYYGVQLLDVTNPAKLVPLAYKERPGCVWFDLNMADGSLAKGLWLPLGVYGVDQVKLGP